MCSLLMTMPNLFGVASPQVIPCAPSPSATVFWGARAGDPNMCHWGGTHTGFNPPAGLSSMTGRVGGGRAPGEPHFLLGISSITGLLWGAPSGPSPAVPEHPLSCSVLVSTMAPEDPETAKRAQLDDAQGSGSSLALEKEYLAATEK